MAFDQILLDDRPEVRGDPVDEQSGRVAVEDHDEDDRQQQHQAALVGVGGRGRDQRRGELRPDVEDDQHHKRDPGRLGGDVGEEQELRRMRRDLVAVGRFDELRGQVGHAGHMPRDLVLHGFGRMGIEEIDQLSAADVLLQVGPQHVEQRHEDRELQQQRQAGRQRVDFVLLIELHQLLLLALFVFLVLFFERVYLRREPLHLLHRLQLAIGQRDQDGPDQDRQADDRQAPAAAHNVVVDEHHDVFEQRDQGRERVLNHVCERDHLGGFGVRVVGWRLSRRFGSARCGAIACRVIGRIRHGS